jgi:hypothetical protein
MRKRYAIGVKNSGLYTRRLLTRLRRYLRKIVTRLMLGRNKSTGDVVVNVPVGTTTFAIFELYMGTGDVVVNVPGVRGSV